jgi:hypothetical protein
MAGMKTLLPAMICFLGGGYFFYFAMKLRKFKAPSRSPAASTRLSVEERQKKILIASRICVACGILMLAGAVLLFWLEVMN